jgi:DNA-binding response OmpR family regulator
MTDIRTTIPERNDMEKILAIEDSAVSRVLLEEILSREYDVVFRETGTSGLESLSHISPDLVLLDVHLPDVDGLEVCRRIKNDPATSNLPVIFITSLDSEPERVQGFEAGGDDYVVKPFYPGELLARVKMHLASRRAKLQDIQLERLNLFREMAVALNHEINNPLTSAFAYLYVLERETAPSSEIVRASLSGIQEELGKIRTLTGKLANASRIEKTLYSDSIDMIDFNSLD